MDATNLGFRVLGVWGQGFRVSSLGLGFAV